MRHFWTNQDQIIELVLVMPKQPADKKAEVRYRAIFDLLQRHGRLPVPRIIEGVASHLQLEVTSNFKRLIERDLEYLEASYPPRIGFLYFDSQGDEIPYDKRENFKNKRKECFLKDGQYHIVGGGLLRQYLIEFHSQKISTPIWSVTDFEKPIKDDQLLFIFNIDRSHLALHVSIEELPLKLIVARKVNQKYLAKAVEEIHKYHPRASLLLLPDSSISRWIPGERLGHVLFEFQQNPHEIKITDLGSTNGTHYQATELRHENRNELGNSNLDDEKTSFLPAIRFEAEDSSSYSIPFGELEVMTEWVKVEFDLDKYKFDLEYERRKRSGLINQHGHMIDENGNEITSFILPELNPDEIKEKRDQVTDALPISVKVGSTTFYIVTT